MKKMFSILKKYEEIISYLVVGVLTTIVSLLVYYICVFTFLDPKVGLELQFANIISWMCSVVFAYITNRIFVFKSKSKNILKEISTFISSRILTLILDMFMMHLMVTCIGLNDKICKFFVQIIVIVINYVLSKLLVFKKTNVEVVSLKNKKSILLIIISIVLALLFTYIDGSFLTKDISNYKYLIEYNDGLIPGSTYYIYIFNDYEITVDRRQYCSTQECINSDKYYTSKIYEVKISLKSKEKLQKYLNKLFKKEETKKIVLKDYDVSDNDKNIINAIIFDNYNYFKYYKD